MSITYTQGPAAGQLRACGVTGQAVANNKGYLGPTIIDNSTLLDAFADVEVVWSFSVTPTVSQINIYMVFAPDGSNFEDGSGDGSSTTVLPAQRAIIGSITPIADTGTHRATLRGVPLLPYKFKVYVYNNGTGQQATVTVNVYTRKDQTVG